MCQTDFLKDYSYFIIRIIVSAPHQTVLDIRTMTRRSIIEGVWGEEGWAQAEARALLDYAGIPLYRVQKKKKKS